MVILVVFEATRRQKIGYFYVVVERSEIEKLILSNWVVDRGSQRLPVGNQFIKSASKAAVGVTFSLPPGLYEVYVNDRYTGRELRVPDDPTEVDDIPVPPEVAGP